MTDNHAGTNPDHRVALESETDLLPEEQAVLDAFDRMSPQGSLQWDFDAAFRRFADGGTGLPPPRQWQGAPGDLWDRGRGAKAGERMMGDVISVLANHLAEDSRAVVADATAATAEAIWDAFRLLAGRVEQLEAQAIGLGVEPGLLALPDLDASEWVRELDGWLPASTPASDFPVVIGEVSHPEMLATLVNAGRNVTAVDPRAERIRTAEAQGANVVMADIGDYLRTLATGSLGAVVLSGCTDRASLVGKAAVVDHALRVLAPAGTLVILSADPDSWDSALTPVAGDLLGGRPLHPDTWALVLPRRPTRSVVRVVVHPATHGAVHAVVAEVGR